MVSVFKNSSSIKDCGKQIKYARSIINICILAPPDKKLRPCCLPFISNIEGFRDNFFKKTLCLGLLLQKMQANSF